ncbi:MAG: ABC transporter ATP-binding protein [Actinomycetota bacterium]
MTAPPVLRLEGVTRDFGGVRAVDAVSFEVMPGERRAVIGPNGAGKTTLFKLISREDKLTAGSIEYAGTDITRLPSHRVARMGLGRTYQITRVFPALTVEENVMLAAQGIRSGKFSILRPARSRPAIVDTAHDAIDHAGLSKVIRAKAAELGHGQQRQLELAIALAGDPRVLLLDEPGAGLSSAERSMMRDLVRGLPDDITLLLIEHDMELALGLADFVICMHNGQTVAEGSPAEIKADENVQDIYLGAGGSAGPRDDRREEP